MTTLRLIPSSGSPIEITKQAALVGRDQACDVMLSDGSVSRRHAKIELRGGSWAIVDQASANGTYIDSQRISDAALKDGQELRLGSLSFRVEITGEADLSQTLSGGGDATMVHAAPAPPAPIPTPPSAPPPLPLPVPPAAVPPPPAAAPPPPPPPPLRATPPPPPPTTPSRPVLSSPVPPMDPGAPPKKGRGPFFWLATGCLGCLGMVILVVALIAGAIYLKGKGSVDVVQTFLSDVRQGRMDDAYGLLSSDLRARMSERAFEQTVSDHPTLKDNVEGRFSFFQGGSVNITNNRGRIRRPLVSSTGLRETAIFTIVNESGTWRISGLRLNGVDTLGRGGLLEDGLPPDSSP